MRHAIVNREILASSLSPNRSSLCSYFASAGGRQGSVGGVDLFLAKRTDTSADFTNPTVVPNVNSGNVDRNATITGDQKALYFFSDRDGVNRIYRSTLSGGTFSAGQPVNLGGGTDTSDSNPVLSSNDLTLFFASQRTGSQGFDIYVATRSNPSVDFGPPTNAGDVAAINSPAIEAPSWLSPDGCHLYLTSDRTVDGGTHAIWVATRPH